MYPPKSDHQELSTQKAPDCEKFYGEIDGILLIEAPPYAVLDLAPRPEAPERRLQALYPSATPAPHS